MKTTLKTTNVNKINGTTSSNATLNKKISDALEIKPSASIEKIIKDKTKEEVTDPNIIRVNESINDTIYAKGDTCLLINPFDTYHLFRVYNNWNTSSKKLFNLAEGNQKIYLLFKSKKSEVRIPEYVNPGSKYHTDKTNGEVLFKITKENANAILSMPTTTFYITRIFQNKDERGIEYSSGEEVIFTGNWADENTWSGTSLTSTINTLKELLENANSQIASLTNLANEYKLKVESLSNENSTLRERVNSLEEENERLTSSLASYENSNEFTSVVITDNAIYQYYKDEMEVDEHGNPIVKPKITQNIDNMTEEQVSNNAMNNLQFQIK